MKDTIHSFLLWALSAVASAFAIIAGLALSAAQVWPNARALVSAWGQRGILIMSGRWFPAIMVGLALLWLWAFVSTGPQSQRMSKPATSDFGIAVLGANIFSPTAAEGFTGICLDVKAWNAGKPAFITEIGLEVIRPGHSNAIAQLIKIPPVLSLAGDAGPSNLEAKDDLLVRVADRAIGEDPIQGKLLFYAPIPQADLMRSDTMLKMSLRDNQNRTTISEKRLSDWITNDGKHI